MTINVSGGGAALNVAITNAKDGDVLLVAPGIYSSISSEDKKIRIESTGGALVTIIDGGRTQRCAKLSTSLGFSNNNTVLVGFTLQNGYGEFGAGSCTGTLINCKLINNHSTGTTGGGGAYNAILINCIITGNTARNGGGVSNGTSFNCLITDNTASSDGGGVYGGDLAPLGNYTVGNAPANGLDFDGNSRIYNSIVDMRAYEWVPPSLVVNPTTQSPGSGAGSFTATVTANIAWTVSSNAGSWFTTSKSSGNNNDTFTIYYTANTGSQRTGTITVSGTGVSSRTITVTQAAATATLTVIASLSNGGSVTGGGTFAVGSNQTINATPATGWNFTQWNDGSTTKPRTVSIPSGGATYTAYFTAKTFTVTLNKQGGSGGSNGANATYGLVLQAGLTAPTRAGHDFTGYFQNVNGGGTQYYTSTMSTSGMSVWNQDVSSPSIYVHWIANNPLMNYDAWLAGKGWQKSDANYKQWLIDPDNLDAVLTATIKMNGSEPEIKWFPDLGEDVRDYSVQGKKNLGDEWKEYPSEIKEDARFFRVRVREW